jgi:hypothetical protein
MAKIEVTGEVKRLLGDKGFTLAEPIRKETNGVWETVGSRYLTVWLNTLPIPNVGDAVTVRGNLSWKLEEYEGKPSMKVNVNANEIVAETKKQSPIVLDDDLPF